MKEIQNNHDIFKKLVSEKKFNKYLSDYFKYDKPWVTIGNERIPLIVFEDYPGHIVYDTELKTIKSIYNNQSNFTLEHQIKLFGIFIDLVELYREQKNKLTAGG